MSGKREGFEPVATEWAQLVRADGDAAYAWNAPAFLELVPAPRGVTLDLGCGEGRLARELARRGHRVIGVDASPTLVRLAAEADPAADYRVADAAHLPLDDASVDLVVAFMTLMDISDAADAIRESARVLKPAGRFCAALVHPVATAGELAPDDATFVLNKSYFALGAQEFPLGETTITSHHRPIAITSHHRPIEYYVSAMLENGLVLEAFRELSTRRRAAGRVPMFLHVRARKAP
jgi:ubiquinone/menaquinone biosynthesis C-methylase UbiE